LIEDDETGRWTRDLDARWRSEVRHAVTTLEGLDAALTLTAAERAGVERALEGGFPLAITPYYLGLCDPEDPNCPVRVQCVPHIAEAEV